MDSIHIRNAVEKDITSICEIYNESLIDGNISFDEPPIDENRYKKYLRINNNRSALIVAECESEILGWCSLDSISERFAYRFTCVGSTYVRQKYRGKKIGYLLKLNQFKIAKDLNYHSIIAEVLKYNINSIEFLINLDYRIVGEIQEAGFRNNKWIGLLILQKYL